MNCKRCGQETRAPHSFRVFRMKRPVRNDIPVNERPAWMSYEDMLQFRREQQEECEIGPLCPDCVAFIRENGRDPWYNIAIEKGSFQ